MIPKILHIIWVGDEARRPDRLVQTWVNHHPEWDVKLWGNQDLVSQTWRCREQLYALGQVDCAAVAAVMRWEILHNEGGVVVAADSLCLRTLDDVLLDATMFTCWQNELAEPGVLCASYVGAERKHPLVSRIVEDIAATKDIGDLTRHPLSASVGSLKLTQVWKDARDSSLSILPSHSFLPRHPKAPAYRGNGAVYACELFASTLGLLDSLATLEPAALIAAMSGKEAAPAARAQGPAPLFSVVIPTYNRMDELGQALASAFAQSGEDIEILVIDDGSTDGTADALAKVDDARLRVVSQANAGTTRARNRGVAEARGRYIVWLDSDDMLMPGTLAAYRERLQQGAPDVIFGDLLVMDEASGQQGRWSYDDPADKPMFPDMFGANRVPNPATLVRRGLYDEVGLYDTELPASEDYDFWLRAAAKGARFAHIGKDVCIYRRTANSRSADVERSRRAEGLIAAKALRELDWSVLFPGLDWNQPQLARAQAMALATKVFVARGAWRELAEAAATLQLCAAALDGGDAGAVQAFAAPAALPVAAPAQVDPRVAYTARRVAEVQAQFKLLAGAEHPRFDLDWKDRWLCLDDNTASTGFDKHYTYHPAWAARILAQTRPEKHVDISSSLQFVTQVSAFIPTEFYDVRPVDMGLKGLDCGRADLTKLPFPEASVQSLSCMHVIEHVGLGRYGDELDYDGDLKAVAELKRVTARGGQILFVVPIGGRARIQFNAHRIYTYSQVLEMFAGWELKEFALIPDQPGEGGLVVGASQQQSDRQQYGCGCFWFVRPHAAVQGLPDAVEQIRQSLLPGQGPNLRAVA